MSETLRGEDVSSPKKTSSTLATKAPPPPPPKRIGLRVGDLHRPAIDQKSSWKLDRDVESETLSIDTSSGDNSNTVPTRDAGAGDKITFPETLETPRPVAQSVDSGPRERRTRYVKQYGHKSDGDITPSSEHRSYYSEEPEVFTPTRIGMQFEDYGRTRVDDYARYKKPVPRSERLVSEYDIIVKEEKGGDNPERLDLISPYLKRVFLSVVKYFPEAISRNGKISFPTPFAPLYFYFEEMVKFVQQDQEASAEAHKMEPLQRFYSEMVAPLHDTVREAVRDEIVVFDHLWALFRPGELLYALDEYEEPRLYVIAETSYQGGSLFLSRKGARREKEENDTDMQEMEAIFPGFQTDRKKFLVDVWHTEWSGITRTFVRKLKNLSIKSFTGARNVTSLEFYPLYRYKDGSMEEIQKLRSSLAQRGNIWKSLVSGGPSCRYYDGPVKRVRKGSKFSQREDEDGSSGLDIQQKRFKERVIVDDEGIIFNFDDMIPNEAPFANFIAPMMESMFGTRIVEGTRFDGLFSNFDHCPPEKDFEEIQAQICPSFVRVYFLNSRIWSHVAVSNLTEVDWIKTAFEHLVLPDDTKKLLKGLVEVHKENKDQGRIIHDVIPQKGQGLIILLHGPPGVGKTLTAESVAEYTKKPLLSINVGELTTENMVVNRLEQIFNQAARWDVVLLLDEADVVLESRSYENIRRNGIVSGKHDPMKRIIIFIRMLEYYQGIIFLTTNRLGTIDIAFQSRISIAIKYKDLDEKTRRRIWENFINLLDESEEKAKEELHEKLDDMKTWSLNGREIRNVLIIAQSLAWAQNRRKGALKYEHVENVASQTMDFQEYYEQEKRESRAKLSKTANRDFQEKRESRAKLSKTANRDFQEKRESRAKLSKTANRDFQEKRVKDFP